MFVKREIGHQEIVHCDILKSKAVRPKISSDGQGQGFEACAAVVWVENGLVNGYEMTVVVERGGEMVDRTRRNRNKGGMWVGSCDGRERCGCIGRR